MLLQELKQSNKPAFNFAIAGFVSLLFAVIGLVLLEQGLKEQKQIAKQVGDLQVIAQNIQHLVTAKSLLHHGEAAAFLSLEKLVKDFNQQWRVFKQQHDYLHQEIKAVDEIWQKINKNADKSLSNKKEVIELYEIFRRIEPSLKLLYKINDELVNVLISSNIDTRQVLMAKQLNVFLTWIERDNQARYDGTYEDVGCCIESEGHTESYAIEQILNGFLSGNPDYDIKKIENIKVREIIKDEIALFEPIQNMANTIRKKHPMLFEIREAQSAIYRDSPELRRMLYKLNNHSLNKGLIVFTICAWLCVFVCVYGYVRALTIGR